MIKRDEEQGVKERGRKEALSNCSRNVLSRPGLITGGALVASGGESATSWQNELVTAAHHLLVHPTCILGHQTLVARHLGGQLDALVTNQCNGNQGNGEPWWGLVTGSLVTKPGADDLVTTLTLWPAQNLFLR
jgi:hypothetical protein